MRLSIIVPVYNMAGEGKLNYCMDSLVHQKLEDYEILAVDDCSTDASFSILKQYEKEYPGLVRVLQTPENLRQGGARNVGMKQATGEWIGFLDADDWVHPEMYARLLQKARQTGADVVGCQYHITYEHSMRIGRIVVNNTADQTGELDEERYRRIILKPGSMVIKIYLKSVIDRYQLSFPEKMFYEDNAAGPLWMLHFKHFELVDEPLYYYYQHEDSTVHVVTTERCYHRMDTARLLIDESRRQGFYDTFCPELEARFTRLYYVNTLFSYVAGVKFPKLSFLKELRSGMLEYFPDFQQNAYFDSSYDTEQKKMIAMHMKNVLVYAVYDRLLRIYRRIRYGKK